MEEIRVLYVGGTYDCSGGRRSAIAETIFREIGFDNVDYYNGGYISNLERVLEKAGNYNLIFWFAKAHRGIKFSEEIKKINKHALFVASRRNIENEHSFLDSVYRALEIKSNLLLEFSRSDKKYRAKLLDPLGNVFADSEDMNKVGRILGNRAKEILSFRRIGSYRTEGEVKIDCNERYLELIRKYAAKFHDFIYPDPAHINRFMGNASFRCENGFPSFRKEDLIFVTRRNLDKRKVSGESFVAVKNDLPIFYFGENKPSVDTPIQIRLYEYYKNINYILHSHAYIGDVKVTKRLIPCGAIEEADEVINLNPDKTSFGFSLNLRGHGSLVLANNLNELEEINYIPRNVPEFQEVKYE